MLTVLKMLISFALLALVLNSCSNATSQSQDDAESVKKAVINYVESFYLGDTLKAIQSVSPNLCKRGYFEEDGRILESTMSYSQLIQHSQTWKNHEPVKENAPRKVTVFEVLDKIATAKVEAQWGMDYFHLAKTNGEWKIINVLWQDYPTKK